MALAPSVVDTNPGLSSSDPGALASTRPARRSSLRLALVGLGLGVVGILGTTIWLAPAHRGGRVLAVEPIEEPPGRVARPPSPLAPPAETERPRPRPTTAAAPAAPAPAPAVAPPPLPPPPKSKRDRDAAELAELEGRLQAMMVDRGLSMPDLEAIPAVSERLHRWRSARAAQSPAEHLALTALIDQVRSARVSYGVLQAKLSRVERALGSGNLPGAARRRLEDQYLLLSTEVLPNLSDAQYRDLAMRVGRLEQEIASARRRS